MRVYASRVAFFALAIVVLRTAWHFVLRDDARALIDGHAEKELVAMARHHDLVPTGGSDFHGTFKPGLQIGTGRGELCVPDEVLDELRSRRAS